MIDHLPGTKGVVVPRTPSHTALSHEIQPMISSMRTCANQSRVPCRSGVLFMPNRTFAVDDGQTGQLGRATHGTVLFLEQNNHRVQESLNSRDFFAVLLQAHLRESDVSPHHHRTQESLESCHSAPLV